MRAVPRSLRPRVWLGVLSIVSVALARLLLPLSDWLLQLLDWIGYHPVLGRLAFIALFVVSTVLLVPGSILVLSGGFLFGFLHGSLLVLVSVVLAATVALLVGRSLARDWVRARLSGHARFDALDRSVQSRGFLIVLLTRLSLALPFNLLNYAYGLSSVRLWPYVFGTWLGMIPAVLLYVYIGSLARDLEQLFVEGADLGTTGWLLMLGSVLIAFAVVVILHRTATALLEQEASRDPEMPE